MVFSLVEGTDNFLVDMVLSFVEGRDKYGFLVR